MSAEVATVRETYLNLHEFVAEARRTLSANTWGYLMGATETETTMRRNRAALDQLAFRPRVLNDVSVIDTTTRFMGRSLRLPVALAPVGSLESFNPAGGAAAGAGASEFGVPLILSSVTHPGLEAVAEATPGPKDLPALYVRGDDAFMDDHVRRAIDAGYDAFCLTVDTASYSRRERDIACPLHQAMARRRRPSASHSRPALNWNHVERFKDAAQDSAHPERHRHGRGCRESLQHWG